MREKEFEIVHHTTMKYLEIFVVEISSRAPHGHDDLEVGILMKGNLTLFTEQAAYELHEGDIYVINRYQIHSFLNKGEKNQILAFQIHTDFYRRLDRQLGFLRFEKNVVPKGAFHSRLTARLTECAASYFCPAPHHDIKCASVLLEALFLLFTEFPYSIASQKESTAAKNNSLRLNRITDYLSDHYRERISLQDIADLENVTPFHISHFIKQMLGISFQDYLNHIRFEHALQLIDTTDFPILDVCLETGFSSSRYLNQMFRKNFGCSVKEYRQKKEKPHLIHEALPVDNLQNRYSFEQSAFFLHFMLQKTQRMNRD